MSTPPSKKKKKISITKSRSHTYWCTYLGQQRRLRVKVEVIAEMFDRGVFPTGLDARYLHRFAYRLYDVGRFEMGRAENRAHAGSHRFANCKVLSDNNIIRDTLRFLRGRRPSADTFCGVPLQSRQAFNGTLFRPISRRSPVCFYPPFFFFFTRINRNRNIVLYC